jgi:hypothetical protein
VKAVDLGASVAPRNSGTTHFQKRRNTMSEETKKIEKIEQEAKQDVKEVKPTELSEQDLDKVAGGANYSTTKSNVKSQTL